MLSGLICHFLEVNHQLMFSIIHLLPKLAAHENSAFHRNLLWIIWGCSLFSISYISKFFLVSSGGYSSIVAPLKWIPLWLKKRQIPFFLLQDISSAIQQLYKIARSWLALCTPIGLLFSRREGEDNQPQPNRKWSMWTPSHVFVFMCCIQQTLGCSHCVKVLGDCTGLCLGRGGHAVFSGWSYMCRWNQRPYSKILKCRI